MRITYYGQACTLIEVAGRRILSDPWLTEGAYFGTWYHTHLLADAAVTPESCPKDIDYLFLSHEHEDHLDPATLAHIPADVPVVICRFPTPKFRRYLEAIGRRQIIEVPSGWPLDLGDGVELTVLGTAEYTNDSALLVSGEGCTVFNETDCKLGYEELQRLAHRRIDIGFYMFSGANWYPMLYEMPEERKRRQVERRRRSLLRSFVERVRLTRPRIAVPAAGPCTVLDPDLLWLNSEDRGIFIDPLLALEAIRAANLPSEGLYMAATDAWDSETGYETHAPGSFRLPRAQYIEQAAHRVMPEIAARRKAEPEAGPDLAERVVDYFEPLVAAQTPEIRRRIGAKVALKVIGRQAGDWVIDFTSAGAPFVRPGVEPGWTYRIQVEDKLLYPFLTGAAPFLEDLFLSLRVQLARRPDVYHEPLYHFFYEPDPERLHNWYAAH